MGLHPIEAMTPDTILDALRDHPDWEEAHRSEVLDQLIAQFPTGVLLAAVRPRLGDLRGGDAEAVLRLVEAYGTPEILEELAGALRAQPDLPPERAWDALSLLQEAGRLDDFPELAEHFLRLASVENGQKPRRLAPGALDFLVQLPWKGNVRELRNLMERVVVLGSKELVSHKELMEVMHLAGDGAMSAAGGPLPLREARARFERQYILDRLSANRGHLGETARELGIERTNLYRKMRQLGISKQGARTRA